MPVSKRKASLLALGVLAGGQAPAIGQAPPGSEIFLVGLTKAGDGLTLGAPERLLSRPGYDNQPFFTPDGKALFFTSIRGGGPGGSTQADIYRIDLESRQVAAFCETPESEYSPTVMPNGRELAVVRVERDSTQRLWAFPLKGGPPRVLAPDLKPVGYQAWFDSVTVGTFVLGEPPTLRITDLGSGKGSTVLSNVGRAMTRIPGKAAIAVTAQQADSSWWIFEVESSGKHRKVIALPEGSDYFTWASDGAIYAAHRRSVFRYRPDKDKSWTFLGEIKVPGFGNISRLTVSPDGSRLAVVLAETDP